VLAERRNLVAAAQRGGGARRPEIVGGFGDGVRRRRERVGLTQEELAERAGVSVRGLRKLEAGEVDRPRPGTVRALASALRVGAAEWDAFRAGAHPGAAGPFRWPTPRQLPAESPRFVAGEAALAALDAALAPGPAFGVPVAVVGGAPNPGSGDDAAALVLHWAHRAAPRYPDAQLFARLRGVGGARRSPAGVLRGFLRALGVPAAEIPRPVDEAAALYRSLLHERRALVVLVGVRDVEQVRPLLPGSPGAAVLLTSAADPHDLAGALGAVAIGPAG
jgi:transcriptional regulator with XRE-family HTH domain